MAALPYMQFYAADYLADTAHLSTLEHGAYLLLILNYWQRGESFRANDEQVLNKRLASVARLSSEEWESVRETLAEFFKTSKTEWRHERIERDLDAVNAKSKKRSCAGKASAATRASKCSTNTQQTFNHTDTDTDTDTDKSKENSSATSAEVAPTRGDPIPYHEILNTLNAALPNVPKARDLTGKRKSMIRTAWHTGTGRRSIEFWRALAAEYAADPFTNGTGPYLPPHENWRPTVDYLLRSDVITKTFERAMDRMERAA